VSGITIFGDRPDLAQLPPLHSEHLYGTELTYEATARFSIHIPRKIVNGIVLYFSEHYVNATAVKVNCTLEGILYT